MPKNEEGEPEEDISPNRFLESTCHPSCEHDQRNLAKHAKESPEFKHVCGDTHKNLVEDCRKEEDDGLCQHSSLDRCPRLGTMSQTWGVHMSYKPLICVGGGDVNVDKQRKWDGSAKRKEGCRNQRTDNSNSTQEALLTL